MKSNLIVAVLLCASAFGIAAQQPRVTNTQFNSVPAGAGLSATVDRFQHSHQPLWLGYEVPPLAGTHISSCESWTASSQVEDGCCGEYQLEGSGNNLNTSDKNKSTDTEMNILVRIDQGAVTKVRVLNAGCHLNAGGIPFTWLTDVTPEDSVQFLKGVAEQHSQSREDRLLDEALVALSLHATSRATEALVSLASQSNSPRLREKGAFWLGAQRGHDGLVALRRLVHEEQDAELRQKLAFDISINSDPAAVDDLITMARSDADGRVRGQALFWLAQKAGKKATATLKNAIENDPEFEVKKKAVFALSQLPKDESIPQLVHIADTNSNFGIRKEAMFWLGQTNDPRALQYLEAVLKR
jgi:hypothetical protein